MRGVIIDAIFQQMAINEDIFFLTGDMGINLVEKFQVAYPSRFVNVGIAEQSLIGVSAGLANLGYRPFAYTISNFVIHRCYEQIRNEIGIHGYPVTLLGTSTGYDNAPLGPTHHIIDDWGALRNIPGIDIYCPSCVRYAEGLVDKILASRRPAYVRIPKGDFKVPDSAEDAVLMAGEGRDVLLVSYGSMVQNCVAVQQANPTVSVLVCNRLRPLDDEVIDAALGSYRRIFVIEDHFPSTGLYGVLCELAMKRRISGEIRSIAPPSAYTLEVGASPAFFHRKYGLDAEGIRMAIG